MDLTLILKRFFILAILVLIPLPLLALDAPQLSGRVNDYARLLSPEVATRLEQKLAVFEQETSTQIVVLTIPSLQGDNIDQFAIRVVEQWKIGQKGKDNGVLLVLAQAERKVRIEVGMGLQGVLPDITAGQIIRDVMRPFLKADNFDQAISTGTDAIMSATKGEFTATPKDQHRRTHKKSSSSLTLFLLAAVAAVILGSYSRYLGGVAGAAGLPLAAYFALPGAGLAMLLILAAAGFAGGLLLSALFSDSFGGSGSGGSGGGFYLGGGGFGGGGYSSGGDSGFSGGGGGFDGGGASGDW
ncbi:MAG: methanol dehydrogenase [Desulfuromonadales bacterium GWD2_54_10]|nr:MAG: methanol dehydrogenase [Desulfuromonadales bacterium GWD2_54_10]